VSDLSELEAKLMELSKLQEDIRKQIELKKKEEENSTPVTFFGFRILHPKLLFNYHPRRDDINTCFKSLGIYPTSTDVSIPPKDFALIKSTLANIPNVTFEGITPEMENEWNNYVPPAELTIEYVGKSSWVLFNNLPNFNVSGILAYESIGFDKIRNKYVLPVSLIHKLPKLIEKIQKRYPTARIVVEDDVETLLEKEQFKRDQLANLTEKDIPPEDCYVLNDTRFRSYQTQCLNNLLLNDGSTIVALEMGLGKTPVSLAFIYETWQNDIAQDTKLTKFLIVTPASLRPNWIREVSKYLPSAKTIHLYGSSPSSYMMAEMIAGDSNVMFISYETLRSSIKNIGKENNITKTFPWSSILAGVTPLRLILDEAHYIKNPETSNAQSIFAIPNPLSITPLTGTPMKNGPKELFTLMKCVNKDLAGNYNSWVNYHTIDNGRVARDPDELRELIKPYMFRRLKRDVIKELPPINRMTIEHELSPKAKSLYTAVIEGFYTTLSSWDGNRDNANTIQSLLAQLIRMKQVCAEDKIDFIADLATEIFDSDESDYRKVIIFSQFANSPPIVDMIAKRLGQEAISFTGNDDPSTRYDRVQKFQNDPSINFLVASTKAASEGLNITAAGHIIFTDLMWTPADHQQAEGRAYGRMNDLHSITSRYVVADGTVEDDIAQILTRKITQNAQVIDGITDESSIAMELLTVLKNRRG